MADDYLSTDPNAGDAVAQPQAAAGYLSTDPNTGAAPGDHQALVKQSLLDHGVKPVAAAAILGDIKQESSFNPHEVGDQGSSFGLMQVGGPMFRQFNADQAAQGVHPGDPEYTYNQAPYVLDRFKQQHPDRWDAMQNADSAPQALQIFRGTKDWGYGIAGKRYQYAQDYEQALQGVPVQQQDTYTRVEKAVPVQEVEHPVARAYPVNGPRPPLPGGPDTLNAPPVPAGYLSIDPNAGGPVTTGTPASIAAPEGNFPLATAVVPPGLINYGANQQVAPTPSGKLPAQPPPDIFASPEAYGQSVSTGQDYTPAEAERANKIWQTRLVNLPRVKAGDISASGQPLSSFDAATVNMARGFASGLTSMEGLFGLIPPVGLAEMAANTPHLIDAVHAAEQTPAWSQDRWEAGLNVITSLGGAGLLGKATIEAGIAGIPKAEAKPGTSLGPAGEGGAAPAGEAGAAAAGGAVPPPTGEAGAAPAGATAATPPRTWADVGEELRWLAKNDPAQFKVRFAEEMAKRRNGEYEVKTDTEPVTGAAPEPAPTQPTAAAAPEPAPETPAPAATAAAPAPEAEPPVVSQPGGPIIPTAITEELAARGHSPAEIAALSAGQAANLVLQPAPDEIAAGTAGPPKLAPAQPGEQPGSAWHGVPFLSQDRVKGELASIGFQPDQIDNMTRSQLDAATPALQAARQAPAVETAGPPAVEAGPTAPEAPVVEPPTGIKPVSGETIAAPANKYSDGKIATGELGQTHAAITPAGYENQIPETGWVTNTGRYVDREEGYRIAKQSKQISEYKYGKAAEARGVEPNELEADSVSDAGGFRPSGRSEGAEPTTGSKPSRVEIGTPKISKPSTGVRPVEPPAPAAPAIGDLVAFRMPAIVKGQAGTMRAAGTVLRTLPDGKLEVRLQQGGYHQIDPSEIISPPAPKGRPAKPLTKAQQFEAEARAEMERQGQEAIAAQGGMELIEAVTHEGGLPLKGSEGAHHYRGELKMLRETIRGTKGVRYKDIFSSKSAGVDPLVLRLRARGFDFQTPDDLLQALDHRLRTGIPHYGLPEAGQARHGQPRVGETPERPLRLGEAPNSGNLHPDPQRASLKQIADDDPGVIEATKRVLDTNPHTRRLRDALMNDGRVVRRGRKIFILDKGGQAVGQVDNATGGLSEFVDVPTARLEKGETPERGFQQRQDKIEQYAGLTTRPPLIAAHGPRFPGDTYEIINGHHRYEAALLKGTTSLRTDASIVNGTGTWISIPRAGQEGGIPDYAARLQNTIAAMQPPTAAPYGEGNPVPAANTAKLAEDIQTFLDFNKVPPAKKPQATEEIKNTLALAGDPALQKFYEGGGFGIPGPQLAAALRANKNRLSIVIHDLISRERPTWNIEGSIIANGADVAMAVQVIRSPDFESFKVAMRDKVTKVALGGEIVSQGTVDSTTINMRDVFRAMARIKDKYPNAELIDIHNHPSGIPRPSSDDRAAWAKIEQAAALQGLEVVDHIVSNGRQYFSLAQEELTGDGYGALPHPVKQPWEVVRQEESPQLNHPDKLAKFIADLRPDAPNAAHIFYTGTQWNLKALERVTNGANFLSLHQAIARGIPREAAYGVFVDFPQKPTLPIFNRIKDTIAQIGGRFIDATWPGMNSAREEGGNQGYMMPPLQAAGGEYNVNSGGYTPLQRTPGGPGSAAAATEPGPRAVSDQPPQVPRLQPLSQMERTTLETLRRAKGTLTAAGKRKLARLEARLITQGDLLAGQNDVFNLQGEEVTDWAARQAQADAAETARVAAQQAAEKAQMSLFEKPTMPYVTGTARVNESTGGGSPPYGPQGASMFSGNTPPRSNPMPIWARRYANKMRAWWQDMLPRSYEIVRKVPESPVISEHQKLMERELAYVQNYTKQPWWQALRRRTEEEIVDLEHQAVTTYRRLIQQGTPRDAAWAQAVAQAPPDLQALFQHREGRVPTERWAAGQLAVDEPAYTGDPYIARLTNEEGKAVVDLHPQIANWGRHIRQSIGSFDKSRVHATMKEGIQNGVQYEPPTMAAFVRELYSARLEGTARMLKRLKDEGVLFDDKAAAIAAGRALPQSAGPVTLVRGFGGKDYWARSRVEAQFLAQNLNTTNSAGAVGKLVRVANAFTRNPNLLYNPLPHLTKNMAFKYALNRIGNFGLNKSAREFGTSAQMRARFEAVMPMPSTGARLPQLRALEAGTYLERMLAKGGKWLSGNHFSARFNFAKADPALRYALWKTYLKKGMSDQAAANHVWVDLVRYDENSGALNFWRGIPLNFFATWRLGSYISLVKALRSHPIRSLLFIGAVEYIREMLYRKYGWWTHLPVDYVDAPLASAIQNPRTIPGVAATTLLFGPGGGQAPSTIEDLMKTLHGDPGNMERVVNMFWGLSQLFNIPHEFSSYLKDKDPKHLALILSNAAFSTHSALKYNPHRLMQWLPEWMPGLEKSAIVRQAEGMQAKIQATQEKARTTYEARHGISQSLEYETPEGQMQALRRAAGVHPPPPGPPKRTKILPSPRTSGKPRGF